jgi:hypothetical protein
MTVQLQVVTKISVRSSISVRTAVMQQSSVVMPVHAKQRSATASCTLRSKHCSNSFTVALYSFMRLTAPLMLSHLAACTLYNSKY